MRHFFLIILFCATNIFASMIIILSNVSFNLEEIIILDLRLCFQNICFPVNGPNLMHLKLISFTCNPFIFFVWPNIGSCSLYFILHFFIIDSKMSIRSHVICGIILYFLHPIRIIRSFLISFEKKFHSIYPVYLSSVVIFFVLSAFNLSLIFFFFWNSFEKKLILDLKLFFTTST